MSWVPKYDLVEDSDFSDWLEYFTDGILDYIEEHGSITQREYSSISSRSLASRKLDFYKLIKLNLIEVKGTGRGTGVQRLGNAILLRRWFMSLPSIGLSDIL